jgi:allantoinase
MKRLDLGRFDLAWGGIASLSLALPVVWTDASQRGFTLDDIARWMSSAPAALAGFSGRAGALAPGREATFVVFNPEAQFTVSPDRLHYRHAITPYMGETLHGVVTATYLRGQPIYTDGSFAPTPHGRELTLC